MTRAFGYPSRLTTEADGEHFREQRTLAVRRLKTGAATGRFDGLYLVGNSPVVLCEIKRYDAIDSPADFERAKRQLIEYARSEDFAEPPPFLVLYSGKPDRTRFFVRKTVADPSLLRGLEYEELPEIWEWRASRSSSFAARLHKSSSRGTACERSCCTTSTGSRTASAPRWCRPSSSSPPTTCSPSSARSGSGSRSVRRRGSGCGSSTRARSPRRARRRPTRWLPRW